MKFKLDENFGSRTQSVFLASGHDVHTVYQELLQGATDEEIFQICMKEDRCLVTLDMDFANVIRFPPAKTSGIVVIRLPRNPSLTILEQLVSQFLISLEGMSIQGMSIQGSLWIVEMGRIRVHQSSNDG